MTCSLNTDTGEILDYPIRSVFQDFYPEYAAHHTVSRQQNKTAMSISLCKTGKLGYTVEECPECGYQKIHARSCNNRNCPCCQAPLEQKWIMERNAELIPGMAYYHVIFTLPHELNPLIWENQKLLYSLLFSSASETLIMLCRDSKYMGALPAIVSVLHTWGQKLNYHPHLHIMLSGGGLTPGGKLVQTRHKGFVIPIKVIGKIFRGKFLDKLKSYHESGSLTFTGAAAFLYEADKWQAFIDLLYKKDWLPYIKETFNGNGNAVKYLARYAYRTAISNARVISVSSKDVTISYKDYTDENRKKEIVLSGTEFIRRFLQHVLPAGFHRVRFGGILANCRKTKLLTLIGKLLNTPYRGNPTKGKKTAELLAMIYGTDICSCPVCRHKLISYNVIRAPDRG